MAQTIKLKRSSVAGKVPTTGQLEIGELALNSTDGKVYFERGDTTIQSFFTTNTLITGSLQQSGSDSYFLSNVGIGTTTPSEKLTIEGNISSSGNLNIQGAVTASAFKVTGGVNDEGTFTWNSDDNTVDLNLNNVTLQLGQETVYHVVNQTGTQINNGEVVYVTGVSSNKLSVAPYSASMDIEADLVLGLATEDIADTEFGFITQFGMVRDINTDGFGVGTPLYANTGSSGYTDITPDPPDHTIFLGFVTKEDATEGQIQLNVNHLRDADEIKTNLSGSGLSSTNVQAALLELDANKINVGALSSNIILYPTTGSSPIPGYLRMVTDVDDPDYNTTAVDVSTGAISSLSGQLIASLASDEGLFVGNPGIINVTTLGNIRKVSGNRDAYFYYELYQSSSSGETLIATSDSTPDITNTSYEEFFASALLNNGTWSATDRVVVKYYGVKTTGGGADPTYEFQFGGTSPVRTLLPVPVSVVPSDDADGIQTDTSNFNNILSGADTDVQKALDTLDDHSHTLQEITDEGNTTTDRIIVGDLTVDTDTIYTDGSGNVGIGTTTPSYKLDVNGSGRFTDDLITSGSLVVREGLTMYGGAVNDSFVFTNLFKSSLFGKNNVIQFRQGGSTANAIMFTHYDINPMLTMIPNSAALAKVGINNADPQYSLDVSGSGNFTDGLTVTGSILHDGDLTVTGRVTAEEFHTEFVSASIVYQSGSTKFGDTSDDVHSFTGSIDISEGNLTLDNQKFIQFRNSVGTPVGTMTFNNSNELVIFNGNSTSGDIKFSDGSYTGTVNMLIEGSSGNVGIGTTSPRAKLDVTTSGTALLSSVSTNYDEAVFEGPSNVGITLLSQNNSNTGIAFADEDSEFEGAVLYAHAQDRLDFWTTGSRQMTLSSEGRLGIGTTSPSQRLHVAGNLRLTGAFYDSNNSAGSSNQILSSTGTGTDWVSLSEITGVDGTGASTQVTYWSDTDTVTGDANFTWDGSTLSITGVLEASEKSFVIDHPTKQDYKLVYGALEGPEHGVYCRGRVPKNGIIELPEEWTGLVDEDTITVQLTPIGKHQNLYVEDIYDNKVEVKNGDLLSSKTNAFYFIQGTRKDVKPLQTLRKK